MKKYLTKLNTTLKNAVYDGHLDSSMTLSEIIQYIDKEHQKCLTDISNNFINNYKNKYIYYKNKSKYTKKDIIHILHITDITIQEFEIDDNGELVFEISGTEMIINGHGNSISLHELYKHINIDYFDDNESVKYITESEYKEYLNKYDQITNLLNSF